jgi:hypothetical protein
MNEHRPTLGRPESNELVIRPTKQYFLEEGAALPLADLAPDRK